MTSAKRAERDRPSAGEAERAGAAGGFQQAAGKGAEAFGSRHARQVARDPVTMLGILILQALAGLSGDRAEIHVKDREKPSPPAISAPALPPMRRSGVPPHLSRWGVKDDVRSL